MRAMKIVILGAGQVGRTAAHQLAREEANEVTVVDTNEELLRDLQDRLDIRTVVGNAAYPSVLEAAGAPDADILVALTSSDEVNMMACEVAYTLYRTPTKIARIRSPEYTRHPKLFSAEALSVDVWISPELLVTDYVERLIRYPGALQVLDFADGRVRLVGLAARKGGLLVGQQLRSLREHIPNTEARVVAIYRGGRSIQPEGDTIIEDGDEVFFLAAKDDIRQFMAEIRREEKPVRRVVIAGGGAGSVCATPGRRAPRRTSASWSRTSPTSSCCTGRTRTSGTTPSSVSLAHTVADVGRLPAHAAE